MFLRSSAYDALVEINVLLFVTCYNMDSSNTIYLSFTHSVVDKSGMTRISYEETLVNVVQKTNQSSAIDKATHH